MSNAEAITVELMTDSRGRLVPRTSVKPVDQLRDRIVRELVEEARRVSDILANARYRLCAELDAFLTLSAEQYGAKVGGDKGNVTMLSFDGLFKVTRQVADHITFDERLQTAKHLVDECVQEWSTGANANIQVLVQYAFQVDKEGRISIERVLGLRRIAIEDDKWKSAMAAISDSVQVTGSTSYLRFYERATVDAPWIPISLDLTNARYFPREDRP